MVRDSLSNFIIFTVFFTHRDGMRTSLLLISSGKTTLRNILTSCVEAAPHAAARASRTKNSQ